HGREPGRPLEGPMRRYAIALGALLIAGFVVQSGPVSAQGAKGGVEAPIGKVVTVEGTVTIERTAIVVRQVNAPSGTARPKAGDFVYRGDVVQTAADSKISLAFTDGTAFNISSNARMELNEFVYDPNGKSNSSLFNLVKGTFTFVA